MRYCLHSNNNNSKNQGAMTIETLQWTTFHSTMARSTFNFNKTAITITSLKFLMRVCVRVLRLPNVERKKSSFRYRNFRNGRILSMMACQNRILPNFVCSSIFYVQNVLNRILQSLSPLRFGCIVFHRLF